MLNTVRLLGLHSRWPRQQLLLSSLVRFPQRHLHASAALAVVKPFILADIGEGIKEVQIIQWFVQPEARVEQFDKLCEVQSDKAATEITSRFDGVIKKLYYEPEDMAQVGKPLCDIDIRGDISPEDEALTTPPAEQAGTPLDAQQPQKVVDQHVHKQIESPHNKGEKSSPPSRRHAALATPAVRGLLKELDVNIYQVSGTGKDGRVVKEDVHKFAAARDSQFESQTEQSSIQHSSLDDGPQRETRLSLTPVQSQMFKTMTRSLSIPHFLYADETNLTALSSLRQRLNSHPSRPPGQKLSYLPFIIKAVSMALYDFPLLNARADIPNLSTNSTSPPQLILRSNHNVGIAMDSPQGLLVPNIKSVNRKSISAIASDLSRLQALAKAGKLSASDLTGGTITVSNIGSIGGTYVSPIIVQSEVAILGVGRKRVVPAFDEEGQLVKKEVINFSWSADHRVVDGATMARMAERLGANSGGTVELRLANVRRQPLGEDSRSKGKKLHHPAPANQQVDPHVPGIPGSETNGFQSYALADTPALQSLQATATGELERDVRINCLLLKSRRRRAKVLLPFPATIVIDQRTLFI
ncbi:hypothetical protein MMC24_000213 [Lignoscripta atroalba]|nr:hypothetical protein [Lignoscripta atroalba]